MRYCKNMPAPQEMPLRWLHFHHLQPGEIFYCMKISSTGTTVATLPRHMSFTGPYTWSSATPTKVPATTMRLSWTHFSNWPAHPLVWMKLCCSSSCRKTKHNSSEQEHEAGRNSILSSMMDGTVASLGSSLQAQDPLDTIPPAPWFQSQRSVPIWSHWHSSLL